MALHGSRGDRGYHAGPSVEVNPWRIATIRSNGTTER
jgi:hypothetical protein